MIDTNQIADAINTTQVVKAQISPYLPALAVGAAWAGRELRNFNAWLFTVGGIVMKHGGIGQIIVKLIWNKNP